MLKADHTHGQTNMSNFMISDLMGSGKTHQVCAFLALADQIGKPTLIVCPKASLTHWRDALRDMTGAPPIIILPGREDTFHIAEDSIVIIPGSILTTSASISVRVATQRSELTDHIQWGRVIIDEAHTLLNAHTLSRTVIMERLLVKNIWALCGCSRNGTFPRNYKHMIKDLNCSPEMILCRRPLPSESHTIKTTYRAFFVDFNDIEKELYEAVIAIGTPISKMRCRQLCVSPWVFKDAVETQAISDKKKSSGSGEYISILRRFLPHYKSGAMTGGKISAFVDFIAATITTNTSEEDDDKEDGGDEPEKFVIFCKWRSELAEYARCLDLRSLPYAKIAAGMDTNRVNEALLCFDAPETRVLLLTLSCGISLGLNLQMADHVVITSPSTENSKFKDQQAIARTAYRKGRFENVTVTRLIMRGTIGSQRRRASKDNPEHSDIVNLWLVI